MKQPDKIIDMTRKPYPGTDRKYIAIGTSNEPDLFPLTFDDLFEDPFEKKTDLFNIRMPEFGFQVARPESFIAVYHEWRSYDDNLIKYRERSDHLRKMVRRQFRKQIMPFGLKMCRTEKEKTKLLLRFLINQRK